MALRFHPFGITSDPPFPPPLLQTHLSEDPNVGDELKPFGFTPDERRGILSAHHRPMYILSVLNGLVVGGNVNSATVCGSYSGLYWSRSMATTPLRCVIQKLG